VDPKASLTENITRHILDPTSRLYDEAEHMLDPFLSDVQVHYSVLSAVARGNTTWHGITKTVGRSSGSLSRPLRWLLDMGVVRREVPVTEPHPARSRRALYRLDDPYLSFWHRFVSPLLRAGLPATLTSERVWHQHVAPHFDDYMGFVFESACRQFLRHAQTLPFQPTRVGRWWSRDGRDEVDAVALAEGHLLVAECKWGSPTADDLATLHRRSQLVAAEAEGPVANVHLVVFAAGEVTDKTILAEADARRIWLVTANEMFADLAGARWLN
jgi:hypothetical protein